MRVKLKDLIDLFDVPFKTNIFVTKFNDLLPTERGSDVECQMLNLEDMELCEYLENYVTKISFDDSGIKIVVED